MKGFKYLLPGALKLWAAIFAFVFIAISFQNGCTCRGCSGCGGCTTSVIVDQKSREIKVDETKVELTANKNRVTNRQLRLDSVMHVDKTIWFSVDYYVSVEDRPEIKNICEYEVPENHDLEKSLNKFNIKFAPDKQHFAIGLDNKVYEFFHLLKDGVPFSSGCYYFKDSSNILISSTNLDFKNIDWKKFPKPDALFDIIILPNNYGVWTLGCNQKNVLELLDQMPPGNDHEMVLIENWYCEIADLHFTQPRVAQILKVSPKWEKAAEKNLIKCINKSTDENDPYLKSSLNMVLWINDKNLLNATDSIVFHNYFAAGNVGDYFIERFKNKNISVKNNIYSQILAKSKEIGTAIVNQDQKLSVKTAVDILLICKEFNTLKTFVEKNVSKEGLVPNYFYIAEATIKKYDKYPKEIQGIMVKNYFNVVSNPESGLDSFDISEIIEFLKEKIPCADLKKLVAMHKSSLVVFQMPKGCHE